MLLVSSQLIILRNSMLNIEFLTIIEPLHEYLNWIFQDVLGLFSIFLLVLGLRSKSAKWQKEVVFIENMINDPKKISSDAIMH